MPLPFPRLTWALLPPDLRCSLPPPAHPLNGAGVSVRAPDRRWPALLFVAYVQRDGPGTTCYRTANSVGCNQHLNPVPWLIVGAVLTAAGLLTQTLRSHKERHAAGGLCT